MCYPVGPFLVYSSPPPSASTAVPPFNNRNWKFSSVKYVGTILTSHLIVVPIIFHVVPFDATRRHLIEMCYLFLLLWCLHQRRLHVGQETNIIKEAFN
jgi:hypothetical protein